MKQKKSNFKRQEYDMSMAISKKHLYSMPIEYYQITSAFYIVMENYNDQLIDFLLEIKFYDQLR